MGLKKTDLVFVHSGITGLGRLRGGLRIITDAFKEVLAQGLLVIPTFTYSWCKGESFNPLTSECPVDVGDYAREAWKDPRFVRSGNPNFSVAVLRNQSTSPLMSHLLQNGNSCFGKDSVFDRLYEESGRRCSYIMLLGGAHNDVIFRTTFIHYIEEKIGVPYRYNKAFHNPLNPQETVYQSVRFFSADEYVLVTGKPPVFSAFPVKADYSCLGHELVIQNLIRIVPFAYSKTRMVPLRDFCNFLEAKLTKIPSYFVSHADVVETHR